MAARHPEPQRQASSCAEKSVACKFEQAAFRSKAAMSPSSLGWLAPVKTKRRGGFWDSGPAPHLHRTCRLEPKSVATISCCGSPTSKRQLASNSAATVGKLLSCSLGCFWTDAQGPCLHFQTPSASVHGLHMTASHTPGSLPGSRLEKQSSQPHCATSCTATLHVNC